MNDEIVIFVTSFLVYWTGNAVQDVAMNYELIKGVRDATRFSSRASVDCFRDQCEKAGKKAVFVSSPDSNGSVVCLVELPDGQAGYVKMLDPVTANVLRLSEETVRQIRKREAFCKEVFP